MSVILGILFLVLAIGIGIWHQRKTALAKEEKIPLTMKLKLPSTLQGIFVHPGHAWVRVLDPSLIAVGVDEFTSSVFGSVESLSLPQLGTRIHQGEKTWRLKRGDRELAQNSPISGTVVAVNQELVNNPKLLAQKDTEVNWILKIKPERLKIELQNLLHGTILRRWNQAIKDQLVATLTIAEFPVLQEGGEIKPGLGD
ncbi:MAG: glycine cleavage system protein H, partial [candidate division Zixibacteria bacterium]|nr:glycine cleavage system protein H [candidate division Zixibacteria bacterium]